jgi:phage terminase small subunit
MDVSKQQPKSRVRGANVDHWRRPCTPPVQRGVSSDSPGEQQAPVSKPASRPRGPNGPAVALPVELTPQQLQFAEAYCKSYNATKAAIEAGYSEGTARQQGARLLTRPHVAAAIDRIRTQVTAKAAADLEITVERTLREVGRLAFFDPRQLYQANGQPIPLHDLPEEVAAAIAGMDVHEMWVGQGADRTVIGVIRKWRFADKRASLELLMKHQGLFAADNRQQQAPFSVALAQFIGQLHSSGGSRLPVRPPAAALPQTSQP